MMINEQSNQCVICREVRKNPILKGMCLHHQCPTNADELERQITLRRNS